MPVSGYLLTKLKVLPLDSEHADYISSGLDIDCIALSETLLSAGDLIRCFKGSLNIYSF